MRTDANALRLSDPPLTGTRQGSSSADQSSWERNPVPIGQALFEEGYFNRRAFCSIRREGGRRKVFAQCLANVRDTLRYRVVVTTPTMSPAIRIGPLDRGEVYCPDAEDRSAEVARAYLTARESRAVTKRSLRPQNDCSPIRCSPKAPSRWRHGYRYVAGAIRTLLHDGSGRPRRSSDQDRAADDRR
jgi:hypothetical protein